MSKFNIGDLVTTKTRTYPSRSAVVRVNSIHCREGFETEYGIKTLEEIPREEDRKEQELTKLKDMELEHRICYKLRMLGRQQELQRQIIRRTRELEQELNRESTILERIKSWFKC